MAASITFFNKFREYCGDGTIDLDDNTFKVMLLTSGYTPNVETQTVKADIVANEISAANGYTAGGVTVAATWVKSTTTVTFDLADAVWTASGGSLTARYAAVYRDGTVNGVVDALVCYVLLDVTPADVVATAGNDLRVVWHANGVFVLS